MTITPAITGRATMKVTPSSVIMTAPAAAPAFTRAAIRRGILHILLAAAARLVSYPTAAPLCSIVSPSTETGPLPRVPRIRGRLGLPKFQTGTHLKSIGEFLHGEFQ